MTTAIVSLISGGLRQALNRRSEALLLSLNRRSGSLLQPCFVVVLVAASAMLMTGCDRKDKDRASAEAVALIKDVDEQRDFSRLLALADSLGKTGDLREGESNYWQGYAHFRMDHRSLANFYWGEALRITANSTDANDLTYYAKSASYIAGQLCRFGEYAVALQTTLPVVNRLEKLACDTTSDYCNLLIFTGCCKANFNIEDQTTINMFERAYQMHLDNIRQKATKGAYHDAVAGLVNVAYTWNYVKEYEKGLLWAERIGALLVEYKERFDDQPYFDKQWGRYKIYRAIALEGLGRHEEASSTYQDYLQTSFSKSMEGLTHSSDYFTVTKRWKEAVECYRTITDYLFQEGVMYSLDNIQRYMLKKYRANVMQSENDSVNATARQICEVLDSAIMHNRRIDANGLQVIHQKDMEIMQSEARSAHHRQINAIVAFLVLVVIFSVYTLYRHRIQRRLANYNARLEQKNRQLTLANARAEESTRMKSDFIQQISHEIRTPLNILSGFTQIITAPDMEIDNETRQDINRQITDSTDRITGLVTKMLELSEANSQTVIERTDEVAAIQIAVQAVEDSGISQADHLAFDFQIAPEAETLMLQTNLASATRALTLLLDNALKFTQPAEAYRGNNISEKKEKALLKVMAEDTCVQFVVEDSGIGVPGEEAERIFEEFVQLDEYYNGTGIGLTVARSLARRLGGDIWLDTSYTGGSRFVMRLDIDRKD